MIALRLEVFETEDDAGTVVTDRAAMEEARRAAYEEGLAAGRAAALAEAEEAGRGREREVARNLQELAFTFHEARTHVLAGIGPLILGMTDALLPAIARETLGARVAEAIVPMAAALAEAPLRLSHHPAARDAVLRLVAESALPLAPEEDPSLPEGAVQLRRGETETRVDLTRAVRDITAAIRGFFELSEQDRRYG